jgi:hypothetical protein
VGQREVVTSRKVYDKAKTSHRETQFTAVSDNLTKSTHQFVYLYNTLLGHIRQLSSAGSRHSKISFEVTVSMYSVFSPNIQQSKKRNMCIIMLTYPYTKQNITYIYIYIYIYIYMYRKCLTYLGKILE